MYPLGGYKKGQQEGSCLQTAFTEGVRAGPGSLWWQQRGGQHQTPPPGRGPIPPIDTSSYLLPTTRQLERSPERPPRPQCLQHTPCLIPGL